MKGRTVITNEAMTKMINDCNKSITNRVHPLDTMWTDNVTEYTQQV